MPGPPSYFSTECATCAIPLCSSSSLATRGRTFDFAALESETSRHLLGEYVISGSLLDSVVLIEHGRLHTQSEAALRIARRLRFPWPLIFAFIVVPRPLRDLAYDLIARHRYLWFGKRDTCMVPTPELKARFIS
jgi:predicted DCC family thiol-disulfide oxidoreductase YuxK